MTDRQRLDWRLDCLEAGVQQRIHLAKALRAEGHGMTSVSACYQRQADRWKAAPLLCLFLAGPTR